MYVRLFIKRVWILEDAIVATAWAGTIGYCAIMRTTMSHHGGEHGWDITHAEASQAAYWFHVSAVEYGFFIGMTKLAVLWLYRRVFSPVRWSPFDMAIVFLAGFTIAFYTSTTLVKIFECTPRERIWNKDIPGRCIQIKWILNPLPQGAHVECRPNLDVPSAPVFATIGFVVRLNNSGNPDTTWNQPEILLWAAPELTSGILCVCFPELAVLFRKKSRNAYKARRPTDTELHGWNLSKGPPAKPPSDPYSARSLMSTILSKNGTAFSTNGDNQYIELQDQGNAVQVVPVKQSPPSAPDGVVVLRNEIKVEHQERSRA
ncbi:putative integral membrane protein [Eutypa lata UCREL1]|uniref:Putative integral membrane protein n=1 Tax=Eutypa lata (strain UCR-EL1) TaxID=1287681 RepID=M7TS85_EUTLA|nr:putative integral membrane protein [Eutypa lata UCREL1]